MSLKSLTIFERPYVNSSTLPTLNPGIVNQMDVTLDMDTDPPENSAPMIKSDLMIVDWEDIFCSLGVAPLVDPGTDCEDELPTPAGPPADVDQEMDSELQKVFKDVVSLPTMVTPVSDMDGTLCMPQAECPVVAPSAVSAFVIRLSVVQCSGDKPDSTGVWPVVDGKCGGWPALPLTPGEETQNGMELGVVVESSEVADRSREGPFDIHQDHSRSVASPHLLQDTQGCLFRMTSYDVESDGPNFTPEHGVQLHGPRLLEYVGAPESARLTSHSPKYWVHHMGREKALSAALQLQHDAGLILSNVQVLQQLVTSLSPTSSDVLLAVHGRQPFPSSAIQQVMPSYRVCRAAHYMMTMGLWRPPVDTGIRTPLLSAACNACTSCQDCFPDVPM